MRTSFRVFSFVTKEKLKSPVSLGTAAYAATRDRHAPRGLVAHAGSTIQLGDGCGGDPGSGCETASLLVAAFTWSAIAWEMGCLNSLKERLVF